MVNEVRRLKFYGMNDGATYWNGDRLNKIFEDFDENKIDYSVTDVIELHNAVLLINNGIFPKGYTTAKQAKLTALKPKLLRIISQYFKSLTKSNFKKQIKDVNFDYHGDLIDLLVAHSITEVVPAETMLPVLKANNVHLSQLLANKKFVTAYDVPLCELLKADVENAEILISKICEASSRQTTNIPPSFTAKDAKNLLNAYIDSEKPNANYLELLQNSRVSPREGFDDKTKLNATRRHEAWVAEFFDSNPQSGVSVGLEVVIDDKQTEDIVVTQNGMSTKFSYSRKRLDENLEPASIIGSFIEVFQFVDNYKVLTMPSYPYELGVFERFIKMQGKETYPAGIAFQFKQSAMFYQTLLYNNYLKTKSTSIEQTVEWYFNTHLKEHFNIDGFKFTPASTGSTYLEKCRHLFPEMDSMIKQFKLYVENDEIDQELLRITSGSVRFAEIPSLLDGKYAVVTKVTDITNIQHCLFSDQSTVTYISEDLSGKNLRELIMKHSVKYSGFHEHQKPVIDNLISLGILKRKAGRLVFTNEDQIALLEVIYKVGALSYYMLPDSGRAVVNDMVDKSWLKRQSTLLTPSEADFFNYYLNQVDFGNGLDLRNKYSHGSQAASEEENEHFKTYIIYLALLMSLVLKINNDLLMNERESQK